MNNKVMILVLAAFGASLNANLQEKLSAKSESINVAKQNVKAGKPIAANDRCQKCGNQCQKA